MHLEEAEAEAEVEKKMVPMEDKAEAVEFMEVVVVVEEELMILINQEEEDREELVSQ
jgi:hypothetical protein